jgi:hypothetical protein
MNDPFVTAFGSLECNMYFQAHLLPKRVHFLRLVPGFAGSHIFYFYDLQPNHK